MSPSVERALLSARDTLFSAESKRGRRWRRAMRSLGFDLLDAATSLAERVEALEQLEKASTSEPEFDINGWCWNLDVAPDDRLSILLLEDRIRLGYELSEGMFRVLDDSGWENHWITTRVRAWAKLPAYVPKDALDDSTG